MCIKSADYIFIETDQTQKCFIYKNEASIDQVIYQIVSNYMFACKWKRINNI